MPDINYVALVVAVVFGLLTSLLWYGVFFGSLWQRLSGISDKELEETVGGRVLENVLSHTIGLIFGAFVLSYFVSLSEATTFISGVSVGFLVWVAAAIFLVLGGALSKKSQKENVFVVSLDLLHWLLVLVVMSGVLAVFQ